MSEEDKMINLLEWRIAMYNKHDSPSKRWDQAYIRSANMQCSNNPIDPNNWVTHTSGPFTQNQDPVYDIGNCGDCDISEKEVPGKFVRDKNVVEQDINEMLYAYKYQDASFDETLNKILTYFDVEVK